MDASVTDAPATRPVAVLVTAIICFILAAVFGVNLLVGLALVILGAEGRALHDGANLLLVAGFLLTALFFAVGLLYLLGGLGLLRSRRRWYRAALVLFGLTILGGVIVFFAQGGNPWDLVPAVGALVGLVLLALPRSRDWFASGAQGGASSTN